MERLTNESLAEATLILGGADADLQKIVDAYGFPPLWDREPGFTTLLHIILEQQVSLASARAALNKLLAEASPLTPERFLEFDDQELKEIGFSRQKTRYGRHLADAILKRDLDLEALEGKPDDEVRKELLKIKGIGNWTADIYLLMVLCRPDIWPVGDLALVTAVQRVKRLEKRPPAEEMESIAEVWRPWRAVAARMLWHYYLSNAKK